MGASVRRMWMLALSPVALAAVLAVQGAGCATAPAKVRPGKPEEDRGRHRMVDPGSVDDDEPDGMRVEGTLGTLDRAAIQAGLSRSMLEFTSCYDRRARHKPFLDGEVSLAFRVTRAGKVKTVRVQRSSLGAFEIERCILGSARTATFERPRGGEAEFSYTVSFNGRVPVDIWDPGMVREELDENRDLLFVRQVGAEAVPLDVPPGLSVTMYVSRRGRVVSAGVTAEGAVDDDFAAHLVAALKQIQFEVPSGIAKVTFSW